jgi:glycosyltransferase involved in cell wall biosynthesis
MGAKVLDFEWVDDFSAAKNFAIEQATGDWIIFFDADEYMTAEDTSKLTDYLYQLQQDPEKSKRCLAINCKLVNIDDNGKAMSVYDAMRVFRNDEAVRFVGSIHERLNLLSENVVWYDGITVVHTGYSESSIKETNKIERNIDLLRKAIAETEDNLVQKVYLADSLKLRSDKESQDEAEKYFIEAIEHGADKIFYKLRVKAYIHLLNKLVNDPEKRKECEDLCKKALADFPDSLDFECFMASLLNYKGSYKEAWDMLKAGEEKLKNGEDIGIAYHVKADPTLLYTQLLLSAQGLGDVDAITKYALLILGADKAQQEVLSPLIALQLGQGSSSEELLALLSKVYTINDPNDLLIIARAAKSCGAVEFARLIMIIAGEVLNEQ